MDFFHALGILRRYKKWALIGLLPALFLGLSTAYSVGPSGIHKKSLEYGAANTQLVVDSPQSTLAFANADVTPLADRAQVFAEFADSTPVLDRIAQQMHVSPSDVAVTIPNTNPNLPTTQLEQLAGQRNSGLLQESRALQLLVVAQPDLPLISIYAQGPNGPTAARLANAAAQSLAGYIGGIKTFSPTASEIQRQAQSGLLPSTHVALRQLGSASGAMVDNGASKLIALLAFLGLAILDCIIVMMIGGLIEKARLRNEFGPAVAAASE